MIPANLLKKVRLACLSVVILTVMMSHSNAEIPSLLNYQGQVTHSGTGEPLDSIVSIVFSIYDDSVTTTPLWTETYSSITVVEGLFAVLLGSQNPVPESIFGDAERWLGIKVGADSEIAPRTRFVSAAYSFHSLYADSAGTGDDGAWTVVGDTAYRPTGRVGIGTSSPQAKMDIVMTEFENNVLRVKAATSAETRLIIEDNAGGHGFISKAEYDLAGLTLTNKDPGNVVNIVSTEADINLRVHPSTGATWENSTLTKLHIDGSTGNVGIGTTNPAAKLHIIDTYSGGKYVTHFNKYGSGPGYIGFNRGTAGGRSYFVFDSAYFGIYTSNGSESSWYNLSFAGNAGVLSTNASFGIGTTTPAKKLQVNASAADAALRLHAPAGDNNRPTPYLLFTGGYKTNNGAAISGKNDQIFGQTALSFYAGWNTSIHGDDPGIGDLYERMRIASNGNVGIGTTDPTEKLHVVGNLCVTGQKNAIVPTSQGMTKLYSEESTELWFTDYGKTKLTNGKCRIDLDPLYLETVTINDKHPMMVFLQEEDDCNGLIVKTFDTYFVVTEMSGGESNATFSYRIVAKRKGQEDARLEAIQFAEGGVK